MSLIFQPWQLLLVILAGWMNQLQQQIIEFQRKEIEVLKKRLAKRRIILNDDERRILAVKAKVLGRKVLLVQHRGSGIGGETDGAGMGRLPEALRGWLSEADLRAPLFHGLQPTRKNTRLGGPAHHSG
jgi:hypothetical protein